jgi:uncharacterized protein (TIGR00266 family)
MRHEILGQQIQQLTAHIAPGESFFSEPGSLLYMDTLVDFDALMTSSSTRDTTAKKVLSVFKRMVSGESPFILRFQNIGLGTGERSITVSPPTPSQIISIKLLNDHPSILCAKGAFLACADGVDVSFKLNRIPVALFSGTSYILQKLSGEGEAFLSAAGHVTKLTLREQEVIVDSHALVGFTETLQYELRPVKTLKNMAFSREGLFLIHFRGSGKIWIQSNSVAKYANMLYNESSDLKKRLEGQDKSLKKRAKT